MGLRIHLSQPLEAGLTLERSELLGRLLPRNTLTSLFIVLSAAVQSPVIDESASATELLKFIYLLSSWHQFKLKDFVLGHSISRSLRVDLFSNRLLGDSTRSRSEIARCPRQIHHLAEARGFFGIYVIYVGCGWRASKIS
jgi:hypothetical protein